MSETMSYIEHRNITKNHTNNSGIHITGESNHLLNSNFINTFNYYINSGFLKVPANTLNDH